MVGFLGGRRKQQAALLPETIDEGSESGSISLNIVKEEPSSNNNNNNNNATPSKRKNWFGFGGGDDEELGGDTTTDEEDGAGPATASSGRRDINIGGGGSSVASSSSIMRDEEDNDTQTTNTQTGSRQKHVETIPDNENEFHLAIQNHDWDGLDMLLRDYDFKQYKKPPPKPKKKNTKKLRVAKYLPDMPELPWKKPKITPISPLLGLDDLGRTPLHLCCLHPVPNKLLVRLLFVARDAASVADETNSLPIHLAVNHRRGVEVIDKLIRGYYQGSWQADGLNKTPFMWAVEIAKSKQEEENPPKTSTFWGFPSMKYEQEWQQNQERCWSVATFLIENRHARRKKLFEPEYKQIIHCLGLAAPPKVIELLLITGSEAFKKEDIASPALSLFITRQYPVEMLEKLVDLCPVGMPKLHKDSTCRGLVSSHYKVGCVSHQDPDDPSHRRESFRMTMQHIANSKHELEDKFEPPAPYLDWWSKLKFLIHLWGSHPKPGGSTKDVDGIESSGGDDGLETEEEEEPEFDEDDLLLHSALSNPDVPPSLIQLLAMMYPSSLDFEHPKSTALPIHLACRLWRYRQYPPKRGEKEISFDKVVVQLLHGDDTRTRKRYKDRLPLHHAIAAGKNWFFIKPLVVSDHKSLHVRDPTTKLYPFQLAASTTNLKFDLEGVTKQQYTPAQWDKLRDYEQDHEMRKVEHFYDLEQLSVIFELLRHSPTAIDHLALKAEEAKKIASGPKRLIIVEGIEASDEVATSMQIKMIRTLFGLGNISGHFISWCYESTRRGWKTHRSNFAVVKEAIMDGFIPTKMDKWWRKLKFWIWQDCPWENIPRRDDFLVHGALCNPDTSPWIIELLLECFPRSASIPIPNSSGCYPLHIACVTDRYIPLPFEFPNKRTVIEMAARAFRDAMLLKWNNRLPLHLAISHSKQWDEISFLAEEEQVSLAVPDAKTKCFAFQLSALDRPYTREQKRRFETMASKEVGKEQWRGLSGNDKVVNMSKVLHNHELGILSCVYELLKRNSALVQMPLADVEEGESDELGEGMDSIISEQESFYQEMESPHDSSSSLNREWIGDVDKSNLSIASLDFLEDVYEEDNNKKLRAERRKKKRRASSFDSQSLQFSDMGSSYMGSSVGSGSSLEDPQFGLRSTEKPHNEREPVRMPVDDEKQGRIPVDKNDDMVDFEAYGEYEEYEELDPHGDYEEYEELDPNLVDMVPHSETNSVLTDDPAIHPHDRNEEYEKMAANYEGASLEVVDKSDTESNLSIDPAIQTDDGTENYHEVDEELAAVADRVASEKADHVGSRSIPTDVGSDEYKEEDPNVAIVSSVPSPESASVPIKHGASNEEDDEKVGSLLAAVQPALDNKVDGVVEKPPQNLVSEDSPKDSWMTLPDDSLAYKPRRKDIILVTKSSAHIVWKNAVMEPGSLKSKSKKNYWLRVLKKLGEDLDMSELPMIRYEQEQSTICSLRIDNSSIMIDEDEAYVWVMCGTRSASLVENFDIEAAMEKLSFLYDEDTLIWLKGFHDGEHDTFLNGNDYPLLVVDAILRLAETGSDRRGEETRDFLVSRGVLRQVFGLEVQDEEGQETLENSIKRLLYDVPGCKLDARFQNRKLLDPRLKQSLAERFEDSRSQFLESEKEVEVFKNLQKKQTHAMRVHKFENASKPMEKESPALPGNVTMQRPPDSPRRPRTPGSIVAKIQALRNSAAYRSEERGGEFFEKSLEIFATKADVEPMDDSVDDNSIDISIDYESSDDGSLEDDAAEDTTKTKPSSSHLNNLNQPKTSDEKDDDSLGMAEMFDPPKGPPPSRPLLAAAKKAAAARSAKATNSKAPTTTHLNNLNQPKTSNEKDEDSLEMAEIFDPPKGPPPSKPLLTAAKKAAAARDRPKSLAKQDTSMTSKNMDQPVTKKPTTVHLKDMNQPKMNYEDDDSLELKEVFDPPKGPPPSKPLLAAAKKAAAARDQSRLLSKPNINKTPPSSSGTQTRNRNQPTTMRPSTTHLKDMNQPKTSYEDDDDSLDLLEVFDPPKGPPPSKPLLTAAKKAAAARDQSRTTSTPNTKTQPSSAAVQRARNINQPVTIHSSTTHLRDMNQPKTTQENDDDSLKLEEVFDPPRGPPPSKPLLAAAKKAAAARDQSRSTTTPNTPKTMLSASQQARNTKHPARMHPSTSHLKDMNQPKTAYENDDDSLELKDVFDPPRGPPPAKPLLAAAKKAAAQRNAHNASLSGAHLLKMNQPKMNYDNDDDSLNAADVFDAPRGPPPKKPLLAAAQKAAAQRSTNSAQRRSYVHASMDRETDAPRRSSASKPSMEGTSSQSATKPGMERHSSPRRRSSAKPPPAPREEGRPTTPTSILKKPRIGRKERVRQKASKQPDGGDGHNSNQSLSLSAVFDPEAEKKKSREKDPLQKEYLYPTRHKELLVSPDATPKKVPAKHPERRASSMTANLVRMNSIEKGLGSPTPKDEESKKKKKKKRKKERKATSKSDKPRPSKIKD